MHGESDRLSRAGSYVLGLMGEADRERAEHDLEIDPAFREAVLKVAERLHRIELPRTENAHPAHWKQVAMHIAGLPQMRGLAEPSLQMPQPPQAEPVGAGPRALPGRVRGGFPSGIAYKQEARAGRRFYQTLRAALVAALCLIAAFAAGYLTALMRM
jgi:hypothetical protein